MANASIEIWINDSRISILYTILANPVLPIELMLTSHSASYRSEIDGLRAVAVLAVIVNHLNHHILPGGYLGVDVFFVISGYVVTASLLNRSSEDLRSFLVGFYQRRFRRLQPALLFVFVVTTIVFSVFVSPSESIFAASIRTGVTSLFGFSNIYLLRQSTNYFATDSQFNPFLQTWSLGVEEQFYLIWPLIIAACSRLAVKNLHNFLLLRWIILFLGSISFIVYLAYSLGGDLTSAFFLPTARFWELAAGSYLAATANICNLTQYQLFKLPKACLPFILPLLVLTFFSPDTFNAFPTFLCVALTFFLISNVQNTILSFKILASPVAVGIGKRSYSIYLWHWPILVMARWTVGVNELSLICILFLITIISLLSYQVESYFRRNSTSNSFESNPIIAYPFLSLLASIGAYFLQGPINGIIFSGRSNGSLIPVAIRHIHGTPINTVNCFREPTSPINSSPRLSNCLYKPYAERPTVFFLGDSHVDALTTIGSQLISQGKYNVSFISRGGCPSPYFVPWVYNRHKLQRYSLCDQHYRLMHSRLLSTINSGDYLVLVSNFSGYITGLSQADLKKASASLDAAFNSLAHALQEKNVNLVLFKPLPFFPSRPKHAQPLTICNEEWFRPQEVIPNTCKPFYNSRQWLLKELEPVNKILLMAQKSNKNVSLYDPFPYLCPSREISCSTHDGSVLLFTDSNHLSNSGASMIVPGLLKHLDSV